MTGISRPSSRRNLLAAGLGAMGAMAASLLRPPVARSADGGTAIIGVQNSSTNTTIFRNSDVDESALWGDATAGSGTGVGVRGDSAAGGGRGVWGQALGPGGGVGGVPIGVDGFASGALAIGVRGDSPGYGSTGVQGRADGTSGIGVSGYGQSGIGVDAYSATGFGVRAISDSGVAVWALGSNAVALRSTGRVQFQRVSGVATIPAGRSSVTVDAEVGLGNDSFVLLTPKANLGSRSLWFTTDPSNDRFTIRISSARPSATKVAWMLIG